MATYSRVKTFVANETLTASDLNAEFNNIITNTNSGNLNSDNVSTSSAWTWTGYHTYSTSSRIALSDDIYMTLGNATDGDYRVRYNATSTALEIMSTDSDGAGTDAVVLDIQDGTDDLRLRGGFSTDNNTAPTSGIVTGGNIVSDTDSTDDLGTTSVRWANLYVDAATITNNLTVGGTLTLTGGLTLNGNVTVGDNATDTLTINSTITSNLLFTDATYDIGASGATRPRDLHLSRNALMGGTLGVTGLITATGGVSGALTGNVTGNVTGDVTGNLTGNVTGNVTGNLTGDVTGNISGNVTGGTISGTTGTFSGAVTVNDTIRLDTGDTTVSDGDVFGDVEFYDNDGGSASAGVTARIQAVATGNYGASNILFSTSSSSGGARTALTERVKIASDGDLAVGTDKLFVDVSASAVGVGTSSPAGLGGRSLNIKAPTANGADLTLEADNGTNFGVLFSGATTNDPFSIYSNTGFKFATASDKNATGFDEHMRLTSAGLLGIGTSSPVQKLELSGGTSDVAMLFNSEDTSYHNIGIKKDGSQLRFIEYGNDGTTENTNIMVLEANGDYVGIGSTAPVRGLHLEGDSGTSAIRLETTGGEWEVAPFYSTFTDGNFSINRIAGSGNVLIPNGSVGIGTSSPDGTLHVHTSSAGSVTAHGSADDLVVESSGDAGLSILTPAANNGRIYFGSPTNNAYGQIDYDHATNDMVFATAGAGRLIIDSSGRVGIGTSPSAALSVQYNPATTNGFELIDNRDTNDRVGFLASGGELGIYTATNGSYSSSNLAIKVDTSQRVGIGTSSPARKLDVVSTAGGTFLAARFFNNTSDASGVKTKLEFPVFNGSSGGFLENTGNSVDGYSFEMGAVQSSSVLKFSTGGSERARIDSSGNFIVGKTTTSANTAGASLSATGGATFVRDADCLLLNRPSTTGAIAVFRQANSEVGTISVTASATAYNTSSDYRLKENVVGITDGITRIKSLKPSRFNFIAEADRTVDGFVAHEVSDIVPEAITGAKDAVDDDGNPQYQGIDQSKLVPLLTAALQEAITKIETLETKVAALEAA